MKNVRHAIVAAIVALILAIAIFAAGAMYVVHNAQIWVEGDQMYIDVFDQVWVYDYYSGD